MPDSISREALLTWYAANKRVLPWRQSAEPYRVWVSEIMLQQTQVATVIRYYDRWLERFPNVQSLAVADEQDVLSAWQGLGYYRRCKLLLKGARWVAQEGMPRSFAEWLLVPGVGRYTAAAIASIALGEPVAVVDGNVERVFARLTGFPHSGRALHQAAWIWAQDALATESPGDWNQAMMELGATVCRPRGPSCTDCPLASECLARAQGRQHELPAREAKAQPKRVVQKANVFIWEGKYGVEQIAEGEWWSGMWRFPQAPAAAESVGEVRHVVTNHKVTLQVNLEHVAEPPGGLAWYSFEELKDLPMPAPQRRALRLCTPVESRVAVPSGGNGLAP